MKPDDKSGKKDTFDMDEFRRSMDAVGIPFIVVDDGGFIFHVPDKKGGGHHGDD